MDNNSAVYNNRGYRPRWTQNDWRSNERRGRGNGRGSNHGQNRGRGQRPFRPYVQSQKEDWNNQPNHYNDYEEEEEKEENNDVEEDVDDFDEQADDDQAKYVANGEDTIIVKCPKSRRPKVSPEQSIREECGVPKVKKVVQTVKKGEVIVEEKKSKVEKMVEEAIEQKELRSVAKPLNKAGIAIPIVFKLSPTQVERFEQLYPGYHFIQTKWATPSDHPSTAVERQVFENMVYWRLRTLEHIKDIGGSPNRHQKLTRKNVHCCCPLNEAKDVVDSITRDLNSNAAQYDVCNAEPENCSSGKADGFMSGFSGINLGAQRICELTNLAVKGIFVMSIRRCKDVIGTINNGEIHYERTETEVIINVHGTSGSFRLKDESWVFDTTYYTDGTLAMAWDISASFGTSHVVTFAKAPVNSKLGNVNKVKLTLTDALESTHDVGLIDLDYRQLMTKDTFYNQGVDSTTIPDAKVYSFWNWMIFVESGESRFYVPKGVVSKLKLAAAGRVRDALLFNTLLQTAKDELKKSNLPVELMARAAVPATILGMQSGVVQEMGLMNRLLVDYSKPIKKLETLLKFQPSSIISKWAMGSTWSIIVLFALVILTSKPIRRLLSHILLILGKRAAPGSIYSIVRSLVYKTYSKFPHWIEQRLTELIKFGNRTFVLIRTFATRTDEVAINFHQPLVYVDTCNSGINTVKSHESAFTTMPQVVACQAKPGTIMYGVAVRIRVPAQARSCVHNEQIAVLNRGVIDRLKPDAHIYILMTRTLHQSLDAYPNPYMLNGLIQPMKFTTWLNRFPPSKRQQFVQARKNLRDPSFKIKTANDTFIKKEHVMKAHPESEGPDGIDLFSPRLIQGRHPEFQVATGPITHSVTKFIAHSWSHATSIGQNPGAIESNIIYTSGMTRESLGASIQYHYNRLSQFGEVVAGISDAVRFDGNTPEEAIEFKNTVYHRFVYNKRVKFLRLIEIMGVTFGITKNGVLYYVKGTIKSGEGDTSVGDSIITGTGFKLGYELVQVPRDLYIIYSCGDDIFTLLLKAYSDVMLAMWHNLWIHAGYKMEISIITNIFDADFCSSRIYPTNDGWVMGPKIGRILAKTFYSKVKYADGNPWVLAVAQGLEKDCSYVPVLRALMPVVISLLKPEVNKKIRLTNDEDGKMRATNYHTVTLKTWAMMEHIYNLNVHQLMELEEFISNGITKLPCTLSHPYINIIVETDLPIVDRPARSTIAMASISKLWRNLSFNQIAIIVALFDHPLLGRLFWSTYATDNNLIDCILSPLVEEIIKYHWPGSVTWIVALESCGHIQLGTFPNYVPTIFMHLATNTVSQQTGGFLLSLIWHSQWNAKIAVGRNPPLEIARQFRDFFRFFGMNSASVQHTVSTSRSSFQAVCTLLSYVRPNMFRVLNNQYVLSFVQYFWSISGTIRNALKHALTGNPGKASLYELCTKLGYSVPLFNFVVSGSPHIPNFDVVVSVFNRNNVELSGFGRGATKRAAEHAAADDVIRLVSQDNTNIVNQIPLVSTSAPQQTWDALFIDCDQIAPTSLFSASKTTYLIGVNQSIHKWLNTPALNDKSFGKFEVRITPATPEAADDIIVIEASKYIRTCVAVVTKDVRLAKRLGAMGIHNVYTSLDTVQICYTTNNSIVDLISFT